MRRLAAEAIYIISGMLIVRMMQVDPPLVSHIAFWVLVFGAWDLARWLMANDCKEKL